MRILVIMTSPFCCDGISKMVLQLDVACRDPQLEMNYLFAAGEESPAMRDCGARIFTLPNRKGNLFRYLSGLYGLLKRERFDAVHIHANSAMVALEAVTARLSGVKQIVVHSHNSASEHPLIHRLCKPVLNAVTTHPLACSDIAGKWLYTKPFQMVKNGIDTEKFRFSAKKREQTRKALGIADCLVVGHLGRFNAQKNQMFLLEIFRQVVAMCPNAKLLMLGGGELSQVLHETVDALGLRYAVIFPGEVENPQDYYPAMDCFLLPSLFEGLPLVLIEAQTEGLPCFVSDRVSAQAKVTDLVEFLPLEESAAVWAKHLIGSTYVPRRDASAEIRQAGYDIADTAKTLLTIYKGTHT